jgi:hypothetical protein
MGIGRILNKLPNKEGDLTLPKRIEEKMEMAINSLSGSLHFGFSESETHRTLTILGWNESAVTRQAIAHYLVGLRASAIDAALNIRSQLEDTPDDRREVIQNVFAIIGIDNSVLSQDQKQDDRNPWIAEGIWHMCMIIAARRNEFHPIGSVISVDYAHIASKDHGLDGLVLYEVDNLFGISIIESKAYRDDPNRAINNAVDFYKEIDNGKHDLRIRQSVQIMRTSLPQSVQSRISGSFWKRERTYLPNPHYDANNNMDWANLRPSFRALKPFRTNIIIMPHIISGFDDFFDQIADEMRNFARSL